MKQVYLFSIALLLCFEVNAQVKDSVVLGRQIWTSRNLDVIVFSNGDTIPEVRSNEDWLKAHQSGKPAWCYFNNDTANGRKYGKLYNWYAVNDPRGLAPKGWKMPSKEDWEKMIIFLDGIPVAGSKLKSGIGWGEDPPSSNSSGFSAVPGASRSSNGKFYPEDLGTIGLWWSNTSSTESLGWLFWIKRNSSEINLTQYLKGMGLSVRCVKWKTE